MLIFKQIPKIIDEIGAIEKNRKGDGINYKFRGIDDIYFALQPLLAKHQVFFAPKVLSEKREEKASRSGGIITTTILQMEYTFYAEDGSSFKVSTIGEAMDTSDKSANKAMSAALKYAILELFCIPTEEEKDTEYRNHEPVSIQKPSETSQNQPQAAISKNTTGYIIPFGKFKGKALGDVFVDDLKSYAEYIINAADKENKKINETVKEFLERVEQL